MAVLPVTLAHLSAVLPFLVRALTSAPADKIFIVSTIDCSPAADIIAA